MNKLNTVDLKKGRERSKMTEEEWEIFRVIVKNRKSAYGTAVILGMQEKYFYDDAEMKRFFITTFETASGWFELRKNKSNLPPLFKAWKPFTKSVGLKNGHKFAEVLIKGFETMGYIRQARTAALRPKDYRLWHTTFTLRTSDEPRRDESAMDVILKIEDSKRLIANRATMEWLGKFGTRYMTQARIEKGQQRWRKPVVTITIKQGSLLIEESQD
jgi:hypothetical protein